MRSVLRELQDLDADRAFIVDCAVACEFALRKADAWRDLGIPELAAVWSESAAHQSSFAFAVAAW